MGRAMVVLVGTATLVAALDLVHKAGSDVGVLHQRSAAYAFGAAAGSVVWAGAIVLTRSTAMAFGGGVLLGGAAGNLTSLAIWPGVPNPIVIEPIPFNLADMFVLTGFVLVCAASAGFAARNRERLREPVRLR